MVPGFGGPMTTTGRRATVCWRGPRAVATFPLLRGFASSPLLRSEMSISRRTILQAAGALAVPRTAFASAPTAAWSAEAFARIAQQPPRVLTADERVTLSAIADALLPRTETPGALDVGVPAFVELLIGEWASESDATLLRSGLAELEAHAIGAHGQGWAQLSAAQRDAEIAWAEQPGPTISDGQRAFRRLKGWITHGWLSSERIQKDVLKVNIIPGTYDGCAPRLAGGDD